MQAAVVARSHCCYGSSACLQLCQRQLRARHQVLTLLALLVQKHKYFTGTKVPTLTLRSNSSSTAALVISASALAAAAGAHAPYLLYWCKSTNADALAAAAGASMSLPNLAKARVPDT